MKLPRLFLLSALALAAARPARAAVDFKKEILPLLEEHCVKCHRAPHEEKGSVVKPKGGIRFDAAWAILQGSKDAVPVKPKDVENSDLVRVVSLPRGDDEAMPPKDKGDPLTPAETALVKRWIAEGADFGGWEGSLEGKPAAVASSVRPPPKDRAHDLLYQKLAEGLAPLTKEALENAKAAGAQVAPIGPESPLLRVDFLIAVSKCNDQSVAALAPIADHIAHLDLARTNITGAALQQIAQMPRLTRLDLRQTNITGVDLAPLAGLQHLTALNLFGSAVTDDAVGPLAKMKGLKSLSLAETKLTPAAREKLQSALPEAEIVFEVDLSAAPKKAKPVKGK